MKLTFLLGAAFGCVQADNVVVGYYAPWSGVGVEEMPFDKLTHINYAFGTLINRNDPASISLNFDKELPQIKKLKSLASSHGVKVLISLGGWSGSQTFSILVRDPISRTRFIENALWFLGKDVGLDGIDLDWEYPGRMGVPCNSFSPFDSKNYLLLLNQLRAAVDKKFPKRLITAAVRVLPFDGPDGNPMTDVSAFTPYFDFINVMTYDIMGPWSDSTGPNSPLHYDARGEQMSMSFSIQSWIRAGFPANKLTAGVAFYGRSMTAQVDMTLDPTNQYAPKLPTTPRGDVDDTNEPDAVCNEGASFSGEWKYRHLRTKILDKYTTYQRFWDPTTMTPWLFDNVTSTFISYDDPQSLKAKANFIKQLNLKGVMIWDLGMDYKDELIDSLQSIRTPSTSSKPVPTITVTVSPTTKTITVTSTISKPESTKTITLKPLPEVTKTITSTQPGITKTVTITPNPRPQPTKTVTVTSTIPSPKPSTSPKPSPPIPCIPDTGECLFDGRVSYTKKCYAGNQWAIHPCTMGSTCQIHQGKAYCVFAKMLDFKKK